jgi:hypothetical protein
MAFQLENVLAANNIVIRELCTDVMEVSIHLSLMYVVRLTSISLSPISIDSAYLLHFSGKECSLSSLVDIDVMQLGCNEIEGAYYKCTSDVVIPIPSEGQFILIR